MLILYLSISPTRQVKEHEDRIRNFSMEPKMLKTNVDTFDGQVTQGGNGTASHTNKLAKPRGTWNIFVICAGCDKENAIAIAMAKELRLWPWLCPWMWMWMWIWPMQLHTLGHHFRMGTMDHWPVDSTHSCTPTHTRFWRWALWILRRGGVTSSILPLRGPISRLDLTSHHLRILQRIAGPGSKLLVGIYWQGFCNWLLDHCAQFRFLGH